MSLLYPDALPRSVCIHGAEYAIRWQYYITLEILKIFDDDELEVEAKAGLVLDLFYADKMPDDAAAAFQAMQEFINRGSWDNGYRGKKQSGRLVDFEIDAPFIWASFRQAYPAWDWSDAHWHEWKAAFDSLPSTSKVKEVMQIRAQETTGKMDAKHREAIEEAKRAFALPDKNLQGRRATDIEAELKRKVRERKNG